MIPAASKWVLSYGLLCSLMFYLSIPPSVAGVSSGLPRILLKLGATEQQSKDLSHPLPSTEGPAAYVTNLRVKRQNDTGNGTIADKDIDEKQQDGPGAENGTVGAENGTSTQTTTSTTRVASNNSSEAPKLGSSSPTTTTVSSPPKNTADSSGDFGELGDDEEYDKKTSRYSVPTKTPFDRDIVERLPERAGDDEAIVETRPHLLHPPITTYMLIVTLPCVVGWCLLTFVCLWICRPNSPLYREILKRLIEHSQMKQKSVLFSATVLAADRHPPAQAAASPGEGPSKA